MKKRYAIPMTMFAAAVLIMTLVAAPQAMAGQKQRQSHELGEGPAVRLPVDRVTIEKKTLKEVITNGGAEYALSDETIIVGTDGKQVSIRQMLVPCDAEITYNTKGNVRQAERVLVQRVSSSATRQWFSKQPE